MRIELGYPDPRAERQLLEEQDRRVLISSMPGVISLRDLRTLQAECRQVKASEALLDYVQRIVAYTRETSSFAHGLSPRGAMALLSCAKSWAFIEDRSFVVPEDIQAVLPSVVEHRLRVTSDHVEHRSGSIAERMLANIDVVG